MKVAIFIFTPAQVHFYKNIIKKLEHDGNDVYVLARGYGETLELLNDLHIPYFPFSQAPVSKSGKILSFPAGIFRAYGYLKDKKIDVTTGYGIMNAIMARLLGAMDILFNDSEPISSPLSYSIQVKLFMLLTGALITPASFRQDMGKKHIRIESFKEMAYLHSNYYTPDDGIYELLGVRRSEDFILLRFNAFDAVHDMGVRGFTREDKIKLTKELEKYARVFISSEMAVPEEIKEHVLKIPKNRIHDVIYFSKLLVTDTQTMATEGALLGTPTIRCNTFVGSKDMGNFIELEKSGLMYNFSESLKAISKALELAQMADLDEAWQRKMNKFMSRNVDMSGFMAWFIENYPESFRAMKDDPDMQYRVIKPAKGEPKAT